MRFIKTQLNLYVKYRINRPAEEDQTAENLQQGIEYSCCSALILWHYLLSSVIYLFNEISYSRVSHLFTVQIFPSSLCPLHRSSVLLMEFANS